MRRKGSLQQLFNGGEEKFPNLFEMLNLKMSCVFNPNPTNDVSSEDQTHVILIRRSEEESPPPTLRMEVGLRVFKKSNRRNLDGQTKIQKPGMEQKRSWKVMNDVSRCTYLCQVFTQENVKP